MEILKFIMPKAGLNKKNSKNAVFQLLFIISFPIGEQIICKLNMSLGKFKQAAKNTKYLPLFCPHVRYSVTGRERTHSYFVSVVPS